MNIGSRTVFETSAPQHALAATPRELRAQAVQRLQVGLFGLALMLLLVGLANIIMDHARANETNLTAPNKAAMTSSGAGAAGNTDPLADISVVPLPDSAGRARGAGHSVTH